MALTKQEVELVFNMVEKITGTHQQGEFRKDILARNIEKCIEEKKLNTLEDYLKLVESNPDEYDQFVNKLTIHTTAWFRENPHYSVLEKKALEFHKNLESKTFRVWSTACSTGEEVYSAVLTLAKIEENNNFKFKVDGSDIDQISIKKAQRAIYQTNEIEHINNKFHEFLLLGENKAAGYFTIDKNLREKAEFFVHSLSAEKYETPQNEYEVIFCRNVLIYFELKAQAEIIDKLVKKLAPNGILILGHCDSFPNHPQLKAIGNSSFEVQNKIRHKIEPKKMTKNAIAKKVLVVDDSPTVRLKIKKILSAQYEIIEADSTANASLVLEKEHISFITLDLNMPEENGAAWLQKMRKKGMNAPVVIVSDSSPQDAERVFGALSSGAEDYLIKSKLHSDPQILLSLAEVLIQEKSEKVQTDYPLRPFKNNKYNPQIVVAGASTGGPEALMNIFSNLPQDFPPVIIVQHISSEFSRALMSRMCATSGLLPGEISDGRPLQQGRLYFATGDYHLVVRQQGQDLYVEKMDSQKMQGHRPSVDMLFNSLAECKVDSIAIILTGMGSDGAAGMKNLVETNRCFTLAQDAASSVVFGMPNKAIQLEAVNFVGNLLQMRNEIEKRIKRPSE